MDTQVLSPLSGLLALPDDPELQPIGQHSFVLGTDFFKLSLLQFRVAGSSVVTVSLESCCTAMVHRMLLDFSLSPNPPIEGVRLAS